MCFKITSYSESTFCRLGIATWQAALRHTRTNVFSRTPTWPVWERTCTQSGLLLRFVAFSSRLRLISNSYSKCSRLIKIEQSLLICNFSQQMLPEVRAESELQRFFISRMALNHIYYKHCQTKVAVGVQNLIFFSYHRGSE